MCAEMSKVQSEIKSMVCNIRTQERVPAAEVTAAGEKKKKLKEFAARVIACTQPTWFCSSAF